MWDRVKKRLTFRLRFVIMYAFKKRGVAQLVARSVRDAEVVGSIPVASTKKCEAPFGVSHFFVVSTGRKESACYRGFARASKDRTACR